MADAGGGHFYFVESVAQIRDHMTSEVGESLEVVARNVELLVESSEAITVEGLAPYAVERRIAPSGEHVAAFSLGDLVADQRISVVLRLNFPHGQIGRQHRATISVTDRQGALGQPATSVLFEYADDRTNDLQPRDRDVDRAVARAFAARVRQEALGLNRQGRFAEASARLDAVAKRIRSYANGDSDILQIVASLEADRPVMSAPMAAMASKVAFFASANEARSRTSLGRAKR
jgi:hypothetical protein